MRESLFIKIVDKWFGVITTKVTEFINGKKGEEPQYLHEQMLSEEFTPTLKWDAVSLNSTRVAADIVSMDSPLPLIKRDSFEKAGGEIPKIGVMLQKNESQIKEIQIMMATGSTEAQIVAKIFDDTKRCAVAVKERIEQLFLTGISTGYALLAGDSTKGVRVNYGFPDTNRFGATIKWGTNDYVPMSDIARIIEQAYAEGNTITKIMLSRKSFNLMRNSAEGRRLAASFAGNIIISTAELPTPTPANFMLAFKDEYGVDLQIVERTVYSEKNGIRTPVKPFEENTLVFLTTDNVGRVVYTSLAEESNQVEGVKYEKVGAYTLISKYSETKPLSEFTTAEAMAVPVIDGVDAIYLLNTQEAQEVDANEVEGDANITVYGKKVVKADVIAALKSIDVPCSVSIGDAKLIAKINELSDEKEAELKELVEAMDEVTA